MMLGLIILFVVIMLAVWGGVRLASGPQRRYYERLEGKRDKEGRRGWCLGGIGQAAEGVPLILQGLALRGATGNKLLVPFFLTTLAEVYGKAAQPEEGLNRLAEAAKLVDTTQERWSEAELHRLRGTLLLSMHEEAVAEDSFRHALTVAQQQRAKFWELRAGLDLARLWRDQGKRTEARDLLAPIYGWFTEGFDTPVLQDAKALLDQLT